MKFRCYLPINSLRVRLLIFDFLGKNTERAKVSLVAGYLAMISRPTECVMSEMQ